MTARIKVPRESGNSPGLWPNLDERYDMTDATRTDAHFWDKVDKSGDCWLWTGAKTPKGYGTATVNRERVYAHRYTLSATGVDIDGRQVDHVCHTPSCVRPDHLRAATNKQNSENLTGPYANSRSGIRGVWWDKGAHQWHASVGHNGTQHRKRFAELEDAAEWVRLKRIELFTHNDTDRVA